jgi:hypothetical protein
MTIRRLRAYHPERREALEKWGAHVAALTKAKKAAA